MVKAKKMQRIAGNLLYWLFFAFLIYIIFELIRKILGGSLANEDMLLSLMAANLGYTFYNTNLIRKVDSKLSGHIGWHKGMDDKD